MVFHTAGLVATFVDQMQQGPVVVQCAQATPESWVKSLLPTFVQTVVSLASITAGVWIALWSFRASGKREHERWVLDQKKAEWREILEAIKVCEDYLPITGVIQEEIPVGVKKDAYQRTRRVQQLFYDRMFVDHSALSEVLAKWNSVNEMIQMEELSQSNYTSAYIGLVEFTRRVARKDLKVLD